MPPLLIAQLISQVGLPLAQELIARVHAGNKPVTAEEWASIAKLGEYRSTDALAAAGISPPPATNASP